MLFDEMSPNPLSAFIVGLLSHFLPTKTNLEDQKEKCEAGKLKLEQLVKNEIL